MACSHVQLGSRGCKTRAKNCHIFLFSSEKVLSYSFPAGHISGQCSFVVVPKRLTKTGALSGSQAASVTHCLRLNNPQDKLRNDLVVSKPDVFNINQCQSIAKMLSSQPTASIFKTTATKSCLKQQDKAPVHVENSPSKPGLQVASTNRDMLYIKSLLDTVDRAILTEYGYTDSTSEVLTLDEIFEALSAVEMKFHLRRARTGDKRNSFCGIASNSELKRAKPTSRRGRKSKKTPPSSSRRDDMSQSISSMPQSVFYSVLPAPPAGNLMFPGAELGSSVDLLLSRSEEKMLLGDLEGDGHKMMMGW